MRIRTLAALALAAALLAPLPALAQGSTDVRAAMAPVADEAALCGFSGTGTAFRGRINSKGQVSGRWIVGDTRIKCNHPLEDAVVRTQLRRNNVPVSANLEFDCRDDFNSDGLRDDLLCTNARTEPHAYDMGCNDARVVHCTGRWQVWHRYHFVVPLGIASLWDTYPSFCSRHGRTFDCILKTNVVRIP